MKYHIEKLLSHEKILCQEIRATIYENEHVLLHFLITQDEEDKNALPEFKMAYEQYRATPEDIEKHKVHTQDDLINHFALIKSSDHQNVLFNTPYANTAEYQQKNEWTGEQPEIVRESNSVEGSHLSATSSENIAVNKNLRYVSEMADNSIYATDDVVTEKTYLSTIDSSVDNVDKSENDHEVLEEIKDNEKKHNHSIWTTNIHFDRFEQCTNEELFVLFRKYKPYIGVNIPPHLDTETNLNIDMESIFGVSFDIVRVKTNLFHNDDDSNMSDVIRSA